MRNSHFNFGGIFEFGSKLSYYTTVIAKFNLTIFLFWWQFRPIRPRNVPSFILMGTNGIEDGRKCGHEKNSFLIKVIYLKALVFKYFVS